MAGRRFTRQERDVIERCRREGFTFRAIGQVLGRDPSSVCREVARNSNSKGRYSGSGAQTKADRRAVRPKARLLDDPVIKALVHKRLTRWRYSSWAVAQSLKREGVPICHETIYREIYHHRFGDPRIVLIRPRKTRRRRTRTGRPPRPLGDFKLITQRPERLGNSHWEADLISGTSNYTAAAVLTHTASKVTFTVALPTRTSRDVAQHIIKAINTHVPHSLRGTLTVDQGGEFAGWDLIEHETGFTVYFCHPRAPWEKPLVESTNAILRRWLPKTRPIPTNQTDLDHINHLINNMPRRALKGQTAQTIYRNLTVATAA